MLCQPAYLMCSCQQEDGNCAVCQNNGTNSTNTKKAELIHQTLIAGKWGQEYDKSHLQTPKYDPAIIILSCTNIKDWAHDKTSCTYNTKMKSVKK